MDTERCRLSNPAHPHILSSQNGPNTKSDCYICNDNKSLGSYDSHYRCESCAVEFHHDCHRFLNKMIHPYHLQHPLTRISQEDEIIKSDKCSWCGRVIDTFFYHCFICNFSLDWFCFLNNDPPLTIKNPKSHHHPLFFFPRPLLVSCDACGSVDVKEPSYACLQCNYMVHKRCIDLPRVIKITRHPHRLYHTPYISPTNQTTLCRICYKTVDIKYGLYSCNLGDCSYVAHAKCATHRNVWDGSELEWEPEEADETEAIQSFKKVGDDLIKHICHEHHLRFKKYDGVRVIAEQCQACILPINSHDFYGCTECEFFLHKVCAHLPQKLNHALHNHPLVLDLSLVDKLQSKCTACSRMFSGFKYKCGKRDCMFQSHYFKLDVGCILVPEYLTHKSHIHPIFISTSHGENDDIFCKVCKKRCHSSHLQCTLCEFSMCYTCATIPDEVYYKYDKHPLFLCYGESTYEKYWCELCEKKVDSSKWFYTCDKCCTTIHRECLFGSSSYMKYGHTSRLDQYGKFEVVRNDGSTRPICCNCYQRCPDFIYYITYETTICCRCLADGYGQLPRQNAMLIY